MYNFRNEQFNVKCQNLHKTLKHFCASFYHFRDIKILNFLHSESRSRSQVQFLHGHRLMANVKIYKRLPHIFALALTVSGILRFKIFDLLKVGQGHGAQYLL